MRIGLAAVLVGLLVAGCGGNASSTSEPPTTITTTVTETEPPATTTTTAPPEQGMLLKLYYVASDGQLVAASRHVAWTHAPGAASLRELLTAPSGTTTKVPGNLSLAIADGKATVTGASLGGAALAQVVYTLTTFPTVHSVNGKTRADVEEFVPAILVEQPAPGDTVSSPIFVTGNANTYEATFNYRLEDAAGKLLAQHFVTATSGNGTRGTFAFTIPFSIDSHQQDGVLKVFELSAEDGSVVHERAIPLNLVS